MTADDDLLERVTRLEVNQENALHRQEIMDKKLDEMYAVLVQAKGARWVLLGILTGAVWFTGFFASTIGKWLHGG